MDQELQRKHHENNDIKKNIKGLSIQLKSCLNLYIFSVLLYKNSIAVRSSSNEIMIIFLIR